MYTGLPTIVGWDWHQRQQRAVLPPTLVTSRIADVTKLYNTTDPVVATDILMKYDVKYVFLGQLERAYYLPQGIKKFQSMVDLGLLRVVYDNDGASIYEFLEPMTSQ